MIHQRPLGNSFSKGRFLYALALPKNKNKSAFILYCARLLDKIFTLEQTNSFVFFLLNQIFRTFAINLRG